MVAALVPFGFGEEEERVDACTGGLDRPLADLAEQRADEGRFVVETAREGEAGAGPKGRVGGADGVSGWVGGFGSGDRCAGS